MSRSARPHESANTKFVGRRTSELMNTIPHKTRIHRLLSAELGKVPVWVISNSDGGLSVADLFPGMIVAAGAGLCGALALIIGYWVFPIVLAVLGLSWFARREVQVFKNVERKCRARRRRGECLGCGGRLAAPEQGGPLCRGCQSSREVSANEAL